MAFTRTGKSWKMSDFWQVLESPVKIKCCEKTMVKKLINLFGGDSHKMQKGVLENNNSLCSWSLENLQES